MPHPRFYGTFPRIIGHYVGEVGLLPLEAAVHKMTGATARALRLADRGLLKPGYRADVTVFDPADFKERATYTDPHQYPSGSRTTVLVNGTPVVDNAVHTGARPGMVLRRDATGAVL
jgi:N-acyl-D-aspartate/D-glutamate deacylase